MNTLSTPAPLETSPESEAPAEDAVRLEGLCKSYGQTAAVRDVNLSVARGELISLLGASGSGKTTLLRMIAGFETVTSGSIKLFGKDVSRLSPADREIGMVFQNYALFPHLTVARNIEYGLRMRGWSSADRKERTAEMLERMRLGAFGARLPGQLSGGQQQRVAIARALAYSPKLLLMDEPLGALDKALKQELLAEIRRVHREFSTTILYVTHDREEALMLADRVALMRDSRLVDCAPVQDMFLRPSTPFAAEFFAGAMLFDAEVVASGQGRTQVRMSGVDREVAGTASAGQQVVLAVRPRDLTLEAVDGWNLDAQVVDLVFLGDDVRVTLAVAGRDSARPITVMVPLATAARLERGADVRLGVDPAVCHLVTA